MIALGDIQPNCHRLALIGDVFNLGAAFKVQWGRHRPPRCSWKARATTGFPDGRRVCACRCPTHVVTFLPSMHALGLPVLGLSTVTTTHDKLAPCINTLSRTNEQEDKGVGGQRSRRTKEYDSARQTNICTTPPFSVSCSAPASLRSVGFDAARPAVFVIEDVVEYVLPELASEIFGHLEQTFGYLGWGRAYASRSWGTLPSWTHVSPDLRATSGSGEGEQDLWASGACQSARRRLPGLSGRGDTCAFLSAYEFTLSTQFWTRRGGLVWTWVQTLAWGCINTCRQLPGSLAVRAPFDAAADVPATTATGFSPTLTSVAAQPCPGQFQRLWPRDPALASSSFKNHAARLWPVPASKAARPRPGQFYLQWPRGPRWHRRSHLGHKQTHET
eukprot:350908-Chlamydomonas_euryale.AAC.1